VEALLSEHGFEKQIEYRYVSEGYLETIDTNEFRDDN
jgi:hypothetical protein